jgi:hypothetical protein
VALEIGMYSERAVYIPLDDMQVIGPQDQLVLSGFKEADENKENEE